MPIDALISEWRRHRQALQFPDFDPTCSLSPHTLVFLETPGPGVEDSKIVSMANNNDTARELYRLCRIGFGDNTRENVLIWNAIPWYLLSGETPNMEHIRKAKPLHSELIKEIQPSLKRVILLGDYARKLLPFLSGSPMDIRLYGGHHTGRKASIQPGLRHENESLFNHLATIHNAVLSNLTHSSNVTATCHNPLQPSRPLAPAPDPAGGSIV